MATFLSKVPDSVVVIHCNHGKGRTGTLICCFLLFVKIFETPNEAMSFYAKKRFETEGLGVTQPCQVKYIHYFYYILKNEKLFPKVLSIQKIVIKDDSELNNPYFKVKSAEDKSLLLNTREKAIK